MISMDHVPELAGVARVDIAALPPHDPCLLLEFKDPSHPRATDPSRIGFLEDLRSEEFADHKLVPKCLNSLGYMLQAVPVRTHYDFYTVIGVEKLVPLGFSLQILVTINTRLRTKLQMVPGVVPDSSAVMAIEDWNRRVPQYPVRRISANTGVAS